MADEILLRRKRAEDGEKEDEIDFFNLPDRREHFQKVMCELSKMVKKYLIEGAPEKSPGMSYFAYYFANLPSTRHEAHWQLQSFLLLEILQELRAMRNDKNK